MLPDGQWVAYSLGTTDAKEDKHDSDIWMVSSTANAICVSPTARKAGQSAMESNGEYLAFLSSRPGKAKGNQVRLLNRQGGEAVQTDPDGVKGKLQGWG